MLLKMSHLGKPSLLKILRINLLLRDSIEGLMAKVKGVGRRTMQLHNGLRNRSKFWELKRKLKLEKSGKNFMHIIFHKFMGLIISRILMIMIIVGNMNI